VATSRRQILVLFLTGAAMSAGVSGLLRRRPETIETEPMPGVPGFERMAAGPVSGFADPFFGIGEAPASASLPKGRIADLHTAEAAPGMVRVASFSDYYCPYCRVLTKMLAEEASAGRIAVTWHELPLLGPRSVTAARAALAAGLQGAYLPYHERLMKGRFVADAPYLTRIAESLGLDPEKLLADMDSPVVTGQLDRSAALGRLFGIYGTPALVVGRVLVLGEINRATLQRLLDTQARV
jgi:hypothetical protein